MATALPGTAFHPSSFIRLLADLADARPAPSAAAQATGLADTLGGWLSWTDAIALSAALNSAAAAPSPGASVQATAQTPAQAAGAEPPAPAAGSATGGSAPAGSAPGGNAPRGGTALRQAVSRERDALALAISSDPALGAAPPARRAAGRLQALVADPNEDPVARLQRCHVKHQRAMDAVLGPLRATVRAALAQQSPALARLAALDAVVDQALAGRERHLLGQVPGLVARPAQRQLASPPDAPAADAGPETLKRLQARWQALLLAELDSRMQPIEGLLQALHHADHADRSPAARP